jgi:hypothetical protein
MTLERLHSKTISAIGLTANSPLLQSQFKIQPSSAEISGYTFDSALDTKPDALIVRKLQAHHFNYANQGSTSASLCNI